MNFELLFTLQKQLDDRIVQEHGLDDVDLFENKLLALKVELGELANETRCFKYWSKKAPSPKETILEEYVDGIHFILSLGLELGITAYEGLPEKTASSEVQAFHEVYRAIDRLSTEKEEPYYSLMESYLTLGQTIGLEYKEIGEAYLKKNKVNHNRQDQGY
ncbi:dUTP diphosphatase [Bacillus sp. N1-1]|jgi:dimeric dUTPase (all-alpha-NTP-PPase superfamily)|uniref:dUTP diphosphatase n=1 Tax=Bacillus sp. N1-1 TaxID=2682541 RepID=UPI001317C48E|nr:dUTP diphosphatase [Bacillus sp. N1-1]QHA92825.1 dUTPase [Bacillus sp. N1-1]